MKSYIALVYLLLSLPTQSCDEKTKLLASSSRSSGLGQSKSVNNAESIGSDEGLRHEGRSSRPIPIPEQKEHSPCLSDYFNPPKSAPPIQVPRRGLFEPHMRRIEEDFIRQLTFKIRVRKHSTETNCIKITIEGFLRDKRMMKQTVDIEY